MKRFSISLLSALILCTSVYGMDKLVNHPQDTQDIKQQRQLKVQEIALEAVSSLKQIIAEKRPGLSEAEQTVVLMQLVLGWFADIKTTANP